MLRYGREVAFATAEVYARAAEVRGAWDARLEALVVDSVLRAEADETTCRGRARWAGATAARSPSCSAPCRRTDATDVFDEVRRVARAAGMDALCATQGDRLVVLLGGVGDGRRHLQPRVPSSTSSARARSSSARSWTTWSTPTSAPRRPVRPPRGLRLARRARAADELLPERALAGDGHARRLDEVYLPLVRRADTLVETLAAYIASGRSLEATARALFCHPNTVRYRLRQIGDLTGFTPSDARDAFTLEIALVLGRQSGRE